MTKWFASFSVVGRSAAMIALTACSGDGDDGERSRADVAEYCESSDEEFCAEAARDTSQRDAEGSPEPSTPRAGGDQTAGDGSQSFRPDIDDFKG